MAKKIDVVDGFQFFFIRFSLLLKYETGWMIGLQTYRVVLSDWKTEFFRTNSEENSVLCKSMENIKTEPNPKAAQFSNEIH